MKILNDDAQTCIFIITDTQLTRGAYNDFLTINEMGVLKNKPEKKRHLSAMGRVAVKRSVKNLTDTTIPYQAIEIFNTRAGIPKYKINNQEQSDQISISHSQTVAVGGLSQGSKGFGLDIEKIRIFNESTIRSFVNDLEWEQYKQLSNQTRLIFPTLIWTVKEATLKALEVGLKLHPKNINVELDNQFAVKSVTIINNDFEVKPSWTLFNYSYIIAYIQLYEKS